MLRFPNPGSTIANFVFVYTAAFERLQNQTVNLDDIVAATVEANLATSSGYMGSEAIARSTRTDRSRDPLYNQLKMYAELFRALGWLHPTENSALNYNFTLLGRQVVSAGQFYMPLLEETVLGIAHPSHILTIRGDHNLRPFAFILRTMLASGDALSRDEMIIGPLSALSDRGDDPVTEVATLVGKARQDPESIKAAVENVSRLRNAQINTLRNYTRWPIAIMRDCGWTEKVRMKFRRTGRSFEVHRLTEHGKAVALRVADAIDIRVDQADSLSIDQKEGLSIHAHYKMLERSGFDIAPVMPKLDATRDAYRGALNSLGVDLDSDILFSPFQSLNVSDTGRIFPAVNEGTGTQQEQVTATSRIDGRDSREHLFVVPNYVQQQEQGDGTETASLKEELRGFLESCNSIEEAAEKFAISRSSDTQVQFYPLVSQMFRILGFKSEHSRAGVNYQRWDACVWAGNIAIPIEIKSPTEEVYLSTKAIRQALENKIILLARESLETSREVTSLIIGYQIPNERGDLSSLIDDIFKTFDVRIGVIDLYTLTLIAMRATIDEMTIDRDQLSLLRGFLHV